MLLVETVILEVLIAVVDTALGGPRACLDDTLGGYELLLGPLACRGSGFFFTPVFIKTAGIGNSKASSSNS